MPIIKPLEGTWCLRVLLFSSSPLLGPCPSLQRDPSSWEPGRCLRTRVRICVHHYRDSLAFGDLSHAAYFTGIAPELRRKREHHSHIFATTFWTFWTMNFGLQYSFIYHGTLFYLTCFFNKKIYDSFDCVPIFLSSLARHATLSSHLVLGGR